MGVFARISRVFGANGAGAARNGQHEGSAGLAELPEGGEETDVVGLMDEDEGSLDDSGIVESPEPGSMEESVLGPPPRTKQELLAELRKNYAEAVGLIRKMDDHLDRQEPRAKRVLDLAERLPEGLDALERIRAADEEMSASVRELVEFARRNAEAGERDRTEQRRALAKIEEAMERSVASGREISAAVVQCSETMTGVAEQVGEAAQAMMRLEERSSERLDEIESEVKSSRRWTVGMAVLFGITVAGLVAMSLGTLVLVRGG